MRIGTIWQQKNSRGQQMKKRGLLWLAVVGFLMTVSCTKHLIETKSDVAVAPIEVKPIHITIDINVRVEKALDDFFGDLDKKAEELK
jgi:hypothetical protein